MPERARAAYVAWLEAQRPVVDGEALSPGLVGAACDLLRGSPRAAGEPPPNATPTASGEAVADVAGKARAAGAEPQRVTVEGFTQLPSEMLEALGMPRGGYLWFLRSQPGGRWEAWTAQELDAMMGLPGDGVAAAPDIEPVRAALRREADEFIAIDDQGAQENGAALRRAADAIESERDAHLVLAALGFGAGAVDRVLGTSPAAAQDGQRVAQAVSSKLSTDLVGSLRRSGWAPHIAWVAPGGDDEGAWHEADARDLATLRERAAELGGVEVPPTGPRIEVRDGREWLVGMRDRGNPCGVVGPRYGVCTVHFQGQHLATGPDERGAHRVLERWPITPASPGG